MAEPTERAWVEVIVNHESARRGERYETSLTDGVRKRIASGYLEYLGPAAPAAPAGATVVVLDPT